VTHLGRRDFVCREPSCARAFGYKHLLRRHAAKAHAARDGGVPEDSTTEDEDSDGDDSASDAEDALPTPKPSTIDMLTGKTYATRGQSSKSLRCPYPQLDFRGLPTQSQAEGEAGRSQCDFIFTRAYDLRRHMAAVHRIAVNKDSADEWTARARSHSSRTSGGKP
jgi:general transcription factor IIIA